MEYCRNFRIRFFLLTWICLGSSYANPSWTLLNADQYHETVSASRSKISEILNQLKTKPHLNANDKIALIANELVDIPYIYRNGMGEGDWQSTSFTYQPAALHVKQNPVYRLDALNCQTLVQITMALYHSDNLAQFEKNY